MASRKVRYPGPGCVVEFMQGNVPTLALVLEEQGGRLRLYTQGRRETSLTAARLLPWPGPALPTGLSRHEMDTTLETHRILREQFAGEVALDEVWGVTQGEVEKASAEWLAGLVWKEVTVDHEAALGRVLLAGKTHFRFTPPEFEIFPAQVVESRMAEAEITAQRESVINAGAAFFRRLWDLYCRRRPPLTPQEMPETEPARRLKDLLMSRLAEPDTDGDGLWKPLVKGLPENPHMALFLATAWGLVSEHYNFWLDRADYERGEEWAEAFAEDTAELTQMVTARTASAEVEAPGFVSIDPETTRDRDDAFFVQKLPDGGFRASVALACPACAWPFGSALDKAVLRRTSSLYLPEGNEHMIAGSIGWQLFSLDAGQTRASLVLDITMDGEGALLQVEPHLTGVRVDANLTLQECEGVLRNSSLYDREEEGQGRAAAFTPTERAAAHSPMLEAALELAQKLQARRLAAGAVITERPDPEIQLEGEGADTEVRILDLPLPSLAHLVVGELMIASNAGLAEWAAARGIPLLHRTQDVALPREFSGIWTRPHDIARVVRALPSASLEVQPRRHAGLGVTAYATVSSPIRRYVDLLNQGQITCFLQTGAPRLNAGELGALLPLLSARLETVSQVQRFRPRYWKLLFFRKQGDKQWWDAVVTDENEGFVTITLPWAQLFIRGRRKLFDEKTYPGMSVQIRIGKVNPLLNEIHIVETREG